MNDELINENFAIKSSLVNFTEESNIVSNVANGNLSSNNSDLENQNLQANYYEDKFDSLNSVIDMSKYIVCSDYSLTQENEKFSDYSTDYNFNEKKIIKKEFENINNSIELYEIRTKKNYSNSYFYKIKEYIGTVEKIIDNGTEKYFECVLKCANSEKLISTVFSFEDVFYESDRKIVEPGAQFIFITGKRREIVQTSEGPKLNGTRNMAEIYFRRIRELNSRELKKANELQENWAKLFD